MHDIEFTDAQQALIGTAGSVYVEACPGAGKTQSIAERYVNRPHGDTRRGVALLSFTNAAIDEARKRCAHHQDLLSAPNFIGTIDSFLNRFLVGPVFASREGKSLTFKDSWASVQGCVFTLPSGPDLPFELSWFDLNLDGTATFRVKRVPLDEREPYNALGVQAVARVERGAAKQTERFLANGVIDCSFARRLMSSYLKDESTRNLLGDLINRRFAEIIIDEVQDCSDSDIELFKFLVETGSAVVLVGDPDQAIYSFRGSDSAATARLTESVPAGDRMSGNFRSSPAICSLVDSLRAGSETDSPRGKYRALETPIVVLPAEDFQGVAAAIRRVLSDYKVDEKGLVCLAHSGETARKCAGAAAPPRRSRSRIGRLAAASHQIQNIGGGPSKDRANAVRVLESTIRELATDRASQFDQDASFLEAVGLTLREYRSGLSRLAFSASPYAVSPMEYREAVLGYLSSIGWDWIDPDRLRAPRVWQDRPVAVSGALAWSTVHGYKGLGSEAVALAVPPPLWDGQRDGVWHWLRGTPDESRRVLYVGASRAEKLLILVVHQSQLRAVEGILSRDGVPHVKAQDG